MSGPESVPTLEAASDDEWAAWIDNHLPEGARIEPTHRIKATVDVDLGVMLPPWVDPDDALAWVLQEIGDLRLAQLLAEQGSYEWPQFLMDVDDEAEGVTGSVGSIEVTEPEVTP